MKRLPHSLAILHLFLESRLHVKLITRCLRAIYINTFSCETVKDTYYIPLKELGLEASGSELSISSSLDLTEEEDTSDNSSDAPIP